MTTTFLRWLLQQTHRDDPVGDLARDAKEDRDRPRCSSVTTWRAYLARKNACEGARRALEEAHRQWSDGTTAAGDGKLTSDERAQLLAMMREQGVTASRRTLGVGASTFDRALCGVLPVGPSALWKIRERLSIRERHDDQPREATRVPCEVHYRAESFHVGAASAAVGFCLLYQGGPHVLLTLRQGVPDVVEIALTPDQADALALMLQRRAADMRRQHLEDAP